MAAPAEARVIPSAEGWLSRQPEAFQAEVYARSSLMRFAAGDVIFRYGDPLGGLYGIVSGALLVTIGPPEESPQLLHVLQRGRASPGAPIRVSQADLGVLSGTSRKAVNAALRRFASDGLTQTGYRSVCIIAGDRLRQFVRDQE